MIGLGTLETSWLMQGRSDSTEPMQKQLSLILPPSAGLQDLGWHKVDDESKANDLQGDEIRSALSTLPATWAWWACRAVALQQRMLLGHSSSLRSATSVLIPEVCSSMLMTCKWHILFLLSHVYMQALP